MSQADAIRRNVATMFKDTRAMLTIIACCEHVEGAENTSRAWS